MLALSRLSATLHDAVLRVRCTFYYHRKRGVIIAIISLNFPITIHIDLEISILVQSQDTAWMISQSKEALPLLFLAIIYFIFMLGMTLFYCAFKSIYI